MRSCSQHNYVIYNYMVVNVALFMYCKHLLSPHKILKWRLSLNNEFVHIYIAVPLQHYHTNKAVESWYFNFPSTSPQEWSISSSILISLIKDTSNLGWSYSLCSWWLCWKWWNVVKRYGKIEEWFLFICQSYIEYRLQHAVLFISKPFIKVFRTL